MAKIEKPFEFTLPLMLNTGTSTKKVYSHSGDLLISGMAYDYQENTADRYDYDLDYIMLDGKNILPVFQCMQQGKCETIYDLDFINTPVMAHIISLFGGEQPDTVTDLKQDDKFPSLYEMFGDMFSNDSDFLNSINAA